MRFVDGHKDSQDVSSQVFAGTKAERHINHIGSENSYDQKQSHYTKLVPNKDGEYSEDKSVSYPTGFTKYQANPNLP